MVTNEIPILRFSSILHHPALNICTLLLLHNTEGYTAKVQIAEDIMEEIERDLEIDCKDEFTGKWTLMYVRMRFVAIAQV